LSISLGWTKSLTDRKPALQNNLVFPDDERGDEPSKAYRLNLQRYDNAIYMNLGTMCDSPVVEQVSLRPHAAHGTEPS